MNFTFLVYFPILSSKDDNHHNRFRHELGSARVKFHRLNQQSSKIGIRFGTCKVRRLNRAFLQINKTRLS